MTSRRPKTRMAVLMGVAIGTTLAGSALAWIQNPSRAPFSTFVTHGEGRTSDALRYRIEHELGWAASVPKHQEVVDLDELAARGGRGKGV